MKFIIKQTVTQEYYYTVEADNKKEAISKIEQCECVTTVRTQEGSPRYAVMSKKE